MDVMKILKDSETSLNLTKQTFKDLGWSEDDIEAGISLFSTILLTFLAQGFPIRDPKFADILSAVSTHIRFMIEQNKS